MSWRCAGRRAPAGFAGTLSAIGALAGCGPSSPSRPALPPLPPALRSQDMPLTKTGPILDIAPNPALGIRVWFAKGMKGHQGAMALLYTARARHPERVAILGAVDARHPRSVEFARRFGAWRPYDVILVNSRESFTMTDVNGKKRRIRFRGYEGKDYRLEDLRQVLVQEYERTTPGETIELR